MFRGDAPKWVYSFVLLFLTLGWSGFLVWLVRKTIATPSALSVVEVSGVGVLLGALITWNQSIVSYWFRKAPPKDGTSGGS